MVRPKRDKEAEEKKKEARRARLAQEKIERDEAEAQIEPVKKLSPEQRIDRLEFVVAKMAHYKGCGKIITEVNLTPWFPTKREMTRWKNEHAEKPSIW